MIINALRQDRPKNCGQTAVAMLTGKTIREVEKVYGHRTTTYPHQHIKAVKALGFYAESITEYTGQELPPVCLVRMAYLKRVRGGKFSTSGKVRRNGHCVLYANGNFFDPTGLVYSMRGIPAHMKIDHFIEVLVP